MKDHVEEEVIRHNIENEEWIEDHTGIKRKPFRVMQREVSTYGFTSIGKSHNQRQNSRDAQSVQGFRLFATDKA
jgi:hypothetical protein